MKDPQHHLDNQARGIAALKQRKEPITVTLAGITLTALPNVYAGSLDSELMCTAMKVSPRDAALDLCTGTGVAAIKAAQMGAGHVIAVDLNPAAVRNAELNRQTLHLGNMEVREGSMFEPVAGMQFDVITINPPYVNHKPADKTEICFWDEENAVTKLFFRDFKKYLKPGGKVFFGWADFADMELLERLSKKHGVTLKLLDSASSPSDSETFLIYELI